MHSFSESNRHGIVAHVQWTRGRAVSLISVTSFPLIYGVPFFGTGGRSAIWGALADAFVYPDKYIVANIIVTLTSIWQLALKHLWGNPKIPGSPMRGMDGSIEHITNYVCPQIHSHFMRSSSCHTNLLGYACMHSGDIDIDLEVYSQVRASSGS
jgi:hypothetical protein